MNTTEALIQKAIDNDQRFWALTTLRWLKLLGLTEDAYFLKLAQAAESWRNHLDQKMVLEILHGQQLDNEVMDLAVKFTGQARWEARRHLLEWGLRRSDLDVVYNLGQPTWDQAPLDSE